MPTTARISAKTHWRAGLRALLVCAVLTQGGAAAGAPPASATPSARLVVSTIVFSGNTVIPTPHLMSIAAPFIGHTLADADLQGLLQRLTDVYLQAGFSTSRAVLPDQETSAGVLRISIVEGFLEQIVVSGTRAVDPAYIAARLQTGLTAPLNLAMLNANLRLLMQERGIANISAELAPGRKPGGAILKVAVEEAALYSAGMRVANDRAPVVGGMHGVLDASSRNLFKRGDEIDLALGLASGLRDMDVRVSVPWSAAGPEFSVRYFRATSELVEEQFEVFGAKTRSSALDIGVSQVLWRRPRGCLKLSASVVGKQSESSLNGQLFSFSPGVENGKAAVRLVRLALQWQQQFARDSLSARIAWSAGLGALGATTHNDGLPDSRFHSAFLQLQWLHTLGPRAGSLYLRGEAQLTSDGLLPLEKFSLGGSSSVRGYRRSRFVRDQGWAAGLEYRLPLLRLPVPGLSRRSTDGQLSAVLFIDAGRAWNHGRDDFNQADPSTTLLAAGPGLRWDIGADTAAEIMWGGVRRHLDNTGSDIQDLGVHFMVTARQSF
jgi:hemolysin activation/secretion protein